MDQNKRIQSETKQLEHLRKLRARQKAGGSIMILMLIIICINCVDELSTSIGNTFQSNVINDFFVANGSTYEAGLSIVSMVGLLSAATVILSPFYRALSDKYGRKIFLVVNTLGMSVGLFLCGIAPNYTVYAIGTALISFFIVHDTQIIYILEVAPTKNRAVFYSVCKAAGILTGVMLPLLRTIFMGNDASKWQIVYLVPAGMAIVVSLITFLGAKESDAFIDSRITYLEKPLEQRLEEEKGKDAEKIGIFPSLKYIFTHEKFRWNAISRILLASGQIAITSYYQSIMSEDAYGTLSTADVTSVLFVYPFIYAGITMLSGIVADKFGRKKLEIIYCITCAITFIFFVAGSMSGWNPFLIGLFYGLFTSTYWCSIDYLAIMTTEMAPAGIRNSLVAAASLLNYAGVGVGAIVIMIIFNIIPLGIACLVVGLPCIILSLIVTVWKGVETNGTKMD